MFKASSIRKARKQSECDIQVSLLHNVHIFIKCLLVDLQEQAAAAAAARAEEEEQLAARPQRKAAPKPVRSRAASPSSDSEEFDSPVARYRGMPSATPHCGRVQGIGLHHTPLMPWLT